jgi:hypothetical protein
MYVDPHLLIIISHLLESLFLSQSDPIKKFALHETNLVLTILLTIQMTICFFAEHSQLPLRDLRRGDEHLAKAAPNRRDPGSI